MTEDEKRKRGGGKPSRTEAVGVRLDPKLKYLAELAGRHQRRTLSSYIEWAIQDSLNRIELSSFEGGVTTVADEAQHLWDVDDADRFAKLALRYPHLLTHEEQVRWKLIKENGYLWRGKPSRFNEWIWQVDEGSLIFDRLRECWDAFCAVARGELPTAKLPTWKKPLEDDIPF